MAAETARYDLAIIGAGPGGYVAALRAAQLGMKVALVERERVGGLCLNWGCIPSKALLWSAELANALREQAAWSGPPPLSLGQAVDRSRRVVDRLVGGIEFLLKKQGVSLYRGSGRLESPSRITIMPSGESIEARSVILATGARPRSLPGVEIDGQVVITSREALAMREPPRSAVIVGGGPIGCEMAYMWRAFGSQVTILEMMERLLPLEDEEVSSHLERAFRRQKIGFRTSAQVSAIAISGGSATIRFTANGQEEELRADKVLLAVGFRPNTEGLGLEETGIETQDGWLRVDSHLETSVQGVYGVGDVTGRLMLAHVASAMGIYVVERLAGLNPPDLDYERMPRATYCQPQVGSVGLTEAQARQKGYQVKVGRFPFRALGKAAAMGQTEGLVKVIADASSGQILGVHIVGADATELLAEATLAVGLRATSAELGRLVHAHPTLSEALKEAALAADGEAIHFLPAS